jgi:diaminopimelate epimerase
MIDTTFYKYQGTGNDFVIFDNRDQSLSAITPKQIATLCHRRFGIGADGLMLLENHAHYDFEMKYFNADGAPGTMCGNGGRCLVKFASDQGIQAAQYHFLAVDGPHEAIITTEGIVKLKMKDVDRVERFQADHLVDTGSPHYVKQTSDLDQCDVYQEGRKIRYQSPFATTGINVNFVEPLHQDRIKVRTYERGVEDETYSCGTGVTAAALVHFQHASGYNQIQVETRGGPLSVEYVRKEDGSYHDIWLCGPALAVFSGKMTMPV